jgi:hypothetical protein
MVEKTAPISSSLIPSRNSIQAQASRNVVLGHDA